MADEPRHAAGQATYEVREILDGDAWVDMGVLYRCNHYTEAVEFALDRAGAASDDAEKPLSPPCVVERRAARRLAARGLPPPVGGLVHAVRAELAAVRPAPVPRAVDVDAAAGRTRADAEALPPANPDRLEKASGCDGGDHVSWALGRGRVLPGARLDRELGNGSGFEEECVEDGYGLGLAPGIEGLTEPVANGPKAVEIGPGQALRSFLQPGRLVQAEPARDLRHVPDDVRRVGKEIPGVDEADREADRVGVVVRRHLTFSLHLRQ
jgi:hypothetical protein